MHFYRRAGQEPGEGHVALPEGLPRVGKAEALPCSGEKRVEGSPVAAGKLQHQVKALPPEVPDEPERLAPGLAPAVHHQEAVQPRVAGDHGLGALGDQIGQVGPGPGRLQGGDHRGAHQDVPRLFELDDQDALISRGRHRGPLWDPWPRPVWRPG